MRDLSELTHHSTPLSSGGEIVVLDTGSLIGPESQAMLGALHSRSPGGIRSHLEVLAKRGSDNFMANFYVGYGHKSIGDLGSVAVFIESVSMLAAKAIQDFPLYNGQEVSTRYVDFSKQAFIDPVNTPASNAILEEWRRFYLHGLAELIPALEKRFPRSEEELEKTYDKAIKARAFDTMRAFLPAAASTNLVCVSTLRQYADRMPAWRNHPLSEVQEIGTAIEKTLLEAFPNSFSDKRYAETEKYHELSQKNHAYFDDRNPSELRLVSDDIHRDLLAEHAEVLAARPPRGELPFTIRECGSAQFKFLLDFGSFRDIQRHRAITLPIPLLTSSHGFEQWYLDELPEAIRGEALEVLEKQAAALSELSLTPKDSQYYLPMGYRTTVRLTGDLKALVYLVELRATRFVHPTLRSKMVDLATLLTELYGKDGLILHLDPEPDRFDVKRGEHDIVIKN
jgi:thymidylate synthase ThyX